MASNGTFATLNPYQIGTRASLGDGNLTYNGTTIDVNGCGTTLGITSGKWYWEIYVTKVGGYYLYTGINSGYEGGGEYYQGYSYLNGLSGGSIRYRDNGTVSDNTSSDDPDRWGTVSVSSTGVSTIDNGDILQVALDYDNKKLWFGKNGTFYNSGNPATGTNAQATWDGVEFDGYRPIYPLPDVYGTSKLTFNFGQSSSFAGKKSTGSANAADSNSRGDFYYTPPSGYLALCTANFPMSTDVDPAETDDDISTKNFGVLTYTGTGTSQSITGLGFQPDLVWIKQRNGSGHNKLTDSSRGVQKELEITDTEGGTQPAESTNTDAVTAFGTDGFTAGGDAEYNGNTNTYVAWCWRANGGTTSTNTQGTHTCTVQANAAAGFSIMTLANYTSSTGVTIGHGLGKRPAFYIHKSRSSTGNWHAYHRSLGATSALFLNGYSAGASGVGYFANTEPTSTVLSLGNTFAGTSDGVVYAWAEVDGYSKFGSYNGNNRDNYGPFVFTGFRPRKLVIKGIEEAYGWYVFDSERSPNNLVDDNISWFPGGSETSEPDGARKVLFMSNGFRVMADAASINGQDDTYAFMCWGDVPFKYNNSFA